MVLAKGGRDYPLEGNIYLVYKRYILYTANWVIIQIPTTLYKNHKKNPLMLVFRGCFQVLKSLLILQNLRPDLAMSSLMILCCFKVLPGREKRSTQIAGVEMTI